MSGVSCFMTNAELQIAIDSAFAKVKVTPNTYSEATMLHQHLNQLLRIQADRASRIIIKEPE